MPYKDIRKKKLQGVWQMMKRRCFYPDYPKYVSYGARGITMCKEWLNFKNFMEWSLTNGYEVGLSIDRIDNDKDYCPQNCRWVDRYVQQNNMRSNRFLEMNGEKHTVSEWARITHINRRNIYYRLNKGWSTERALTIPTRIKRGHIDG